MMTQAFYTGIAGVKSNSTAIDAVSDNLANNSTIGYRGYDVEFSSLLEKEVSSASELTSVDSSVGIGTQVQATPMNQTNGELLLSLRNTDLAIDGDGWFGIQGDKTMYTRAGNFNFDVENDLVTADGFYVLGTLGNNIKDNVLTKEINDIPLDDIDKQQKLNFPKTLYYPPKPTKNSKFFGNLGIVDETRTMSTSAIDGLNNKNEIELTFKKSLQQNPLGTRWDVTAVAKSLDGNTIYDTQKGVVEFDSRGALDTSTLTSIKNNDTEINIDLGKDFSGIISTDTLQVSGSSSSDGTLGGDLLGYEVNMNAEVIATFTNGMQSSVGKIALYHFNNDQGLERISGTKFKESPNSGKAIFFKDKDGNNILGANVVNYKLESSNYNIATGLTELIILQRAYDANSKSISTADQMMQKALSMDA